MKNLELSQMEEVLGGNEDAILCAIGIAGSAIAIAGLFAAGPIGWGGIGALLTVGGTLSACDDAGLY